MEVWKSIPNYEGLYEVSSLGKVKSLPRKICNHKGCHISKEKILRPGINSRDYLSIVLFKNNSKKSLNVHQLIAMAFLNHTPCGHNLVVDHINKNKIDNRLENLQLITNRKNCSKDVKNKTSKYTGVSLDKRNNNRWKSLIKIKGKTTYLGYFKCELAAHLAYQNKLKELC